MFVLIDVCCNERPMASATLINRLAKSVSNMGSGPPEANAVGVGMVFLESTKLRVSPTSDLGSATIDNESL